MTVRSVFLLVPVERIELPTFGLQKCCFTAELNRTLLGRIGSTRSIKHDGYCLIVRRDSKRVRSFTRNGHDIPTNASKRLRPRILSREQALEQAKAFARAMCKREA